MQVIEFTVACPHCGDSDTITKKNGYFKMQIVNEAREGYSYNCGQCGARFKAEIKLMTES